MGVCAGLALILMALLGKKLVTRQQIAPEGWALALGSIGVILTFLSGLMAVTWPLTVNPPLNILFAEPSLLLGVLLVAASLFLWKQKEAVNALASSNKVAAEGAYVHLRRVLSPMSWIIFGLGLVLTFSVIAIFRFTLVGSAPAIEPISGLLHDYPLIENTFFGILYALPAIGTLLAPFALRSPNGKLPAIVGYTWFIAGVLFLLFSAMNYYTHAGMLVNITTGSSYTF